jgi:hypothetical protein
MIPTRQRAIVWLIASGALITANTLGAAQDKPAAVAASQATTEAQDMTALSQAVESVAAGRPVPDGLVTWGNNHFIRSQGDSVYVPFTVVVDKKQLPAATTAVYVRVVSRTAPAAAAPPAVAPRSAWETTHAVEIPANGQMSRAVALPPGTYDLYVAVKDKGASLASSKIGVMRHELTVPALPVTELSTSSVILAKSLEQLGAPLAPEKQQENPYVFGPLKIQPSIDGKFSKAGDLQVLFWIYGASQTAGKPDVQVDFSFYQRLPEGEKYFNKTNPQELSGKTLPAEFNMGLGHQLLSSLSVPLTSFPPGDYRLEIKVTDKPSGKSLTSDVTFSVSAP